MSDQSGKKIVSLKPGREKPVRQGHPWIFSGAIAALPSAAADGDIVTVADKRGNALAQGYLNRKSQIQVRVLTLDPAQPIDEDFWRMRLVGAIARRARLAADATTTVYRLVNAESDYLPGLTVDRMGDYLVVQAGTLAIDQRKAMLARLLLELTDARGVIERSDMAVRAREGLAEAQGLLGGMEPPPRTNVLENGFSFGVDLRAGQKTGFYADQRENRARVAAYCPGKRVLDAFAYTGGFGVYALAAGADHVTSLDVGAQALELCAENMARNGFDPATQNARIEGDAFEVLRAWRDGREPRFDVIILDPPKFATARRNVERALRGYKDINLLALQLLKPGGTLATFSCSGLVDADLFQKVVFGAAVDAGRDVQILEWLRQAPDHPTAITFPEGQYLKGLICHAV
ncbi:MAG: class I SAM-dependent rRNA methyltransferase [Caldilineaceae bacterium]|nr:class I SAM-dependent rRNA methyltransferase [Caldilineaceae bacterium]